MRPSKRSTRQRLVPRPTEPTIRFVCNRGHGECLVGELGMDGEGKVWFRAIIGRAGEDVDHEGKALMICPQCPPGPGGRPHEKQISEARAREALEAVNASTRRSVTYHI